MTLKPPKPDKAPRAKKLGEPIISQKPEPANPDPVVSFEKPRAGLMWSSIALGLVLVAGIGIAGSYALMRNDTFSGAVDTSGQMRSMADRMAQVEGQRSRINTLENSVNRFEATRNSMTALSEKQESDTHRLEESIQQMKPKEAADLAPLEARLNALEQKLGGLSQQGIAEKEQKLAEALSALALKQAIDLGQPFTSELALSKTFPANAELATSLSPYAQNGLPTRASLLQRFPAAADLMLRQQSSANASFYDRLSSFASSLISVRKSGNIEGDSLEARLARCEYQLQNGSAILAYKEFVAIPDDIQQRAADFSADLSTRAKADELTQKMILNTAQTLKSAS